MIVPEPPFTARSNQVTTGFTLIELSIVLVIVGLITGGVLVGGDLIKAAEVRSEVSILTKYETAFHTFTLKYNAIPGDATEEQTDGLPNVDPTHYGDGDGMIDPQGFGLASDWLKEYGYAWEHLSQAGLIEGRYDGRLTGTFYTRCTPDDTCPKASFNKQVVHFLGGAHLWGIWTGSTIYHTPLASSDMNSAIFLVNANSVLGNLKGQLFVDQAYALDAKLDDGIASSGRLLTTNDWLGSTGCVNGSVWAAAGALTYNRTDTLDDCVVEYIFR